MLVVATGARTRFGGIAAALQSTEPPSAFERGIHRLGVLILRLTSSWFSSFSSRTWPLGARRSSFSSSLSRLRSDSRLSSCR